jgi:complex iron-sulfur molybdoenzyme family reductase subunit gamma
MQKPAFPFRAACLTAVASLSVVALIVADCSQAQAIRPADHSYSEDKTAPSAPAINTLNGGSTAKLIDSLATEWSRATATEVQLYSQDLVSPRGGGSTAQLSVKAARTADGLALRLEWSDTTCDDVTTSSTFKDGAAIQFPAGDSRSKGLAMGHSANPVNIWHWTADASPGELDEQIPHGLRSADKRQRQNRRRHSGTGGAFKELVATGAYTQQMKPSQFQKLEGSARWRDGRWYVSIFRPFGAVDDVSPNLSGASVPVAFAIWNGSQGERLGMKSISNWTVLGLR